MKYHFKIHEEDQGFWAECIELKGCVVQADTIEELCDTMYEALNLYIEEPVNSKHLAPLPDISLEVSKKAVEVPVDPQIAFAFLIRYYRIKNNLTQQEVSKRIGFDKVYSYQRLESKQRSFSRFFFGFCIKFIIFLLPSALLPLRKKCLLISIHWANPLKASVSTNAFSMQLWSVTFLSNC